MLVTLLAVVTDPADAASAKINRNSVTGGDCTTIGIWDSATLTCTLTTNLVFRGKNGIEIVDNNITVDGNGHLITDSGGYTSGGAFSARTGITIKNLRISQFNYGINILSSTGSTITGNILENNTYGIYAISSINGRIYNNNFINNTTQALVMGGNGNGDSFCDAAYAQYGVQDSLPWTTQNGWVTQTPVDPSQIGKPALKLSAPAPFWGSYADYLSRVLSVDWTIRNAGAIDANAVQVTRSDNSGGVSLLTPLPVSAGNIAAGSSTALTLRYQVPISTGSWRSVMAATAMDGAGTTYTYP